MRIDSEVMPVLKGLVVDGQTVRIAQQLDRPLYVKTNKVLECLGGRWDRKAKGHVFADNPGDRLTDAVAMGQVIDAKKELQFFETPADLADRLVREAQLLPGRSVLEPSAGKGAILKAIERSGVRVVVTAVEIQEGLVPAGLASCVACTDFLSLNWDPVYDRVIMNPPFRNGQDIAHVMHAWKMLSPGGRLVAITAPGWTFRNDRKHTEFRDWVSANASIQEEIPAGAFTGSGTDIRTILIVADKE